MCDLGVCMNVRLCELWLCVLYVCVSMSVQTDAIESTGTPYLLKFGSETLIEIENFRKLNFSSDDESFAIMWSL